MRGRPPKVDHIRDRFLSALTSAESLHDKVQEVGSIRELAGLPTLHLEHVRRVIELAFLGVVAAWDDFIEGTFVRYVAGAKSGGGYSPSLLLGKSRGIPHAYQLVSGDSNYDPEKSYLAWSEPSIVIGRALLFFDNGRPYGDYLNANRQLLQHASSLRNRVAHSSKRATAEFRTAANYFRGRSKNERLVQGLAVGDVLTMAAVRHFGGNARAARWSVFQAYIDRYRRIARGIVP